MLVRSPKWRIIGLLAFALMACAGGARAWQLTESSPGPTGDLFVSRPTIRWKVIPGRDTVITGATMTLDGQRVPAVYSLSQQAVIYTPDTPLSTGQHTVQSRLTINGQFARDRAWRFTVRPGAREQLPAPDATQRALWEAANAIRRQMGLLPFRLDERLCASAAAHSAYLAQNNATGHDEDPSLAGFVGRSPTERAAAFGFGGGCAEDITYGGRTAEEAVARLVDAPYHRLPFMEPGAPEFGAAMMDGVSTLNFAGRNHSGVVTYPVDGQHDVPVFWRGNETPDPLRLHAVRGPVGYVIVFARFAPGNPRIRISKATLSTAGGQTVPFYLNTPQNDDKLARAAFIIPRAPLQPGTTYQVSVEASSEQGADISRRWQFVTAEAGPTAAKAAGGSLREAGGTGRRER